MKVHEKLALGARYGRVYASQQWALQTGRGAGIPSMLCGLLNWECNFKCFFCMHPYYNERPVMNTEEWRQILTDLKAWLGGFRINFLGGEPFLRPDLMEILGHARNLGILSGLTTNASLITEDVAKEMAHLKLFSVGISMDGVTADVHESVRGCPGLFDKARAGIANMKKYCDPEMKIVIRTIIMKENLHEIIPMVKWVQDWGLNGVIFQPLDPAPVMNPVKPDDVTDALDFDAWIKTYDEGQARDFPELNRVVDELITMQKAGAPIMNEGDALEKIRTHIQKPKTRAGGRCPVGVQNFMILPNGDVHTCCDTMTYPPVGNLLETPAKALWHGDKANEIRQITRNCKRTCLFFSHARRTILDNLKMFVKYV